MNDVYTFNINVNKMNIILDTLNKFYFDPTITGYNAYRVFHSNCMNGLLHTVFMPIALIGFFLIVNGLTCDTFTEFLRIIFSVLYFVGYFNIDPYMGSLTVIIYYMITYLAHEDMRSKMLKRHMMFIGFMLLLISVTMMELVGHGLFENHHSHLWEFFNSVFHTPLYGMNSIKYLFTRECSCF